MHSACPQVRDAVITMLDDWVGERGRVPLERLAPAVHDVTAAPKMSPEGRTAAIAWLGGALAAEQVRLCCTVCHNLRDLIASVSQVQGPLGTCAIVTPAVTSPSHL